MNTLERAKDWLDLTRGHHLDKAAVKTLRELLAELVDYTVTRGRALEKLLSDRGGNCHTMSRGDMCECPICQRDQQIRYLKAKVAEREALDEEIEMEQSARAYFAPAEAATETEEAIIS